MAALARAISDYLARRRFTIVVDSKDFVDPGDHFSGTPDLFLVVATALRQRGLPVWTRRQSRRCSTRVPTPERSIGFEGVDENAAEAAHEKQTQNSLCA